ncbi:hypothetical protein GCM10009594_24370 [Kocuria palustris]|uniref:hypothetical protein n=1 Tax=Kocuria palustris TaxID=71999 RepID=UPI0019560E1C|nr:hypothetical protein [Kocuria palustris]MBM7822976.1 hypothetical protein [Kocuria palustris]
MGWTEIAAVVAATPMLLGLGLVVGFSPTLYGATLRALTRTNRPEPPIAAMAAGLAVGSTVMLLAFRTVDPSTWIDDARSDVEAVLIRRAVDLVAAAVFLVAGAVVLRWARRPRASKPAPSTVPHEDRLRMAGVGFVNTFLGFSGFATMYVVGRMLTGLSHDIAWQAVAYLPFLLTLVGPYLLAAWAWPRVPTAARRVTAVYDWVTHRDLRPLLGWGLVLAGLAFAVVALFPLLLPSGH